MAWLFLGLAFAFVAGMVAGVVLAKFPPAGLQAPPAGAFADSPSWVSSRDPPTSPTMDLAELEVSLESDARRIRETTPAEHLRVS